jgi:hypothetical protein
LRHFLPRRLAKKSRSASAPLLQSIASHSQHRARKIGAGGRAVENTAV